MGMTMTQKILAKHAGLEQVEVGQLIEAKLDMVLGNDITTPAVSYTHLYWHIPFFHYDSARGERSVVVCLYPPL